MSKPARRRSRSIGDLIRTKKTQHKCENPKDSDLHRYVRRLAKNKEPWSKEKFDEVKSSHTPDANGFTALHTFCYEKSKLQEVSSLVFISEHCISCCR